MNRNMNNEDIVANSNEAIRPTDSTMAITAKHAGNSGTEGAVSAAAAAAAAAAEAAALTGEATSAAAADLSSLHGSASVLNASSNSLAMRIDVDEVEMRAVKCGEEAKEEERRKGMREEEGRKEMREEEGREERKEEGRKEIKEGEGIGEKWGFRKKGQSYPAPQGSKKARVSHSNCVSNVEF